MINAAKEMELAELRLAIVLSEALEQQSKSGVNPAPQLKKTSTPASSALKSPPYMKPAGPAPSNPSTNPPPYMQPAIDQEKAAGEAFKLTSKPLKPTAQRAVSKTATAASIAERKMRLKEMEASLLQQLEALRAQQEKAVLVCALPLFFSFLFSLFGFFFMFSPYHSFYFPPVSI